MQLAAGDSNQSWMEMGYVPPVGHTLQRHGSSMSQTLPHAQGQNPASQGLANGSTGLVKAGSGLVNGSLGPVNVPAKHNAAVRHQRWNDNPFVDQRWPFTPMEAEQQDPTAAFPGYERLPFDNRPGSPAANLRRAVSNLSRQGSALIRNGSGDQYMTNQQWIVRNRNGAGMMRQASSPGQFGLGMPLPGLEMPWEQQWAPALPAAAAVADSLVIHGPHSLLERQGPGALS